jgi:hypothetical protein
MDDTVQWLVANFAMLHLNTDAYPSSGYNFSADGCTGHFTATWDAVVNGEIRGWSKDTYDVVFTKLDNVDIETDSLGKTIHLNLHAGQQASELHEYAHEPSVREFTDKVDLTGFTDAGAPRVANALQRAVDLCRASSKPDPF